MCLDGSQHQRSQYVLIQLPSSTIHTNFEEESLYWNRWVCQSSVGFLFDIASAFRYLRGTLTLEFANTNAAPGSKAARFILIVYARKEATMTLQSLFLAIYITHPIIFDMPLWRWFAEKRTPLVCRDNDDWWEKWVSLIFPNNDDMIRKVDVFSTSL